MRLFNTLANSHMCSYWIPEMWLAQTEMYCKYIKCTLGFKEYKAKNAKHLNVYILNVELYFKYTGSNKMLL